MVVIYWIVNSIVQFTLSILFSLLLTLFEWFSQFLLKPFDFAPDMFVAVFGKDITEGIETISISAGIAISVLLLIFGLIRVFSGRFTDDVPNPFALVGRFIIAIICNYWIINIIYKYVFPFAQNFFNRALSIGESANLLQQNLSDAVSNVTNLVNDETISIPTTIGVLADQALTGLSQSIGLLIILIIFAGGIIAFAVNAFKLIIENAERYFTVNLLVITGPLASSTIVSEKSIGIFKSWWQMLISNILTIIFNVIGFRMMIFAFNNCMTPWLQQTFDIPLALTSLIALVAASKMIQKFDQLLAQLTFKINPIQNRSLIMSTLSGITGMQKGLKGLNKTVEGRTGKSLGEFAKDSLSFGRMPNIKSLRDIKTPRDAADLAKSYGNQLKNDILGLGRLIGVGGNNTSSNQMSVDDIKPNNSGNLINIPYNAKDHASTLKAANKAPAVPVDLNDDSFQHAITPEGFENLKKNLEDEGNSIYGLRHDNDGNLSIVLGPRDGEGGFAPDTFENAISGNSYYFDTPAGENPLDSLPQGKFIAGAETIDSYDENNNKVSSTRYYTTSNPDYANPRYHKFEK